MRNPNDMLTPDEVTAAVLKDFGLPLSTNTLGVHRFRGDGPLFYKISGPVRYKYSDVIEWLETRMAPRRCNSRFQYADNRVSA